MIAGMKAAGSFNATRATNVATAVRARNGAAIPFRHDELLEQRCYSEQDRGGHDADAKREADDCRNQLKKSCARVHNLYPLTKHL